MLQVRENKISLRKWSGSTAQLRTLLVQDIQGRCIERVKLQKLHFNKVL